MRYVLFFLFSIAFNVPDLEKKPTADVFRPPIGALAKVKFGMKDYFLAETQYYIQFKRLFFTYFSVQVILILTFLIALTEYCSIFSSFRASCYFYHVKWHKLKFLWYPNQFWSQTSNLNITDIQILNSNKQVIVT